MFISERFKFIIVEASAADSAIEYLFVEMFLNESSFVVGVIYRPSGNIDNISDLLSEIISKYENIIMGDFNLNLLNSSIKHSVFSFFDNFNLSVQTNAHFPTHFDQFTILILF